MNSNAKKADPFLWKLIMAVVSAGVAGCCLWVLWADVTAFEDIETELWATLAIAVPALAWLVLALIGLAKYQGWGRWGLLAPLFIAVTVVLTLFDVPGRIGWLVSRDAMNRAVVACDAHGVSKSTVPADGEKIGVYTFHSVDCGSDGVYIFHLLRDYPGGSGLFVYRPDGEPRKVDHTDTIVSLGGSWYYLRR